MSSADHWERVAAAWTAWARAPEPDAFWAYCDELRAFLPAPGRHTLDLGRGEGRVSRLLTELGHRVTAADAAPSLLAAAEQAGSASAYQLADAAALPFPDGEFDRVVAYNVLMDVPDMPAAVAEAARVLAPGGVLTVSVVHPFADGGRFEGDEFAYSGALTRAGLAITELREPRPARVARNPALDRWRRVPLFLWLTAQRLA